MHPSWMKLSIGTHLDLNGIQSISSSMYSFTWEGVYLEALVIGISAIMDLEKVCQLERHFDLSVMSSF